MARTSSIATLIRGEGDPVLAAPRPPDQRKGAKGSLVLVLVLLREIGRDDGSARAAREFDLDLAERWPCGWFGPAPTLGSQPLEHTKGER